MWSWLFRSRYRQPREAAEDDTAARSSDADRILELQRAVGNRAVGRLLEGQSSEVPFRPRMEAAFGENFGSVRAYLGRAGLGVSAATHGEEIAFASSDPDPRLVAHELTHVVQARRYGEAPADRAVSHPYDGAEREAHSAAERAAAGGPVEIGSAPSAAVSLEPTPPLAHGSTMDWPPKTPDLPPSMTVFEKPEASADAAGARKALDEYGKMAPGNRKAAFDKSFKTGALAKVLAVLPATDAAETYRPQVRELLGWMEEADQAQARQFLRRVEEEETRKSSGKTDEEMATAQAKFITVPAKTKVLEGTAYKPAVKTRWEMLSADKQADWTKRGNAAIAKLVDLATKSYPELKLTTARLQLGFKEIDQVAEGALAYSDTSGPQSVAVVGFEFVTAVEADAAYALSTIVHEVFGHPEFDQPGTPGYQLALWRKATPKVPGYATPGATEEASVGYHESEIYSLLRELPYWTAVPASVKGVDNPDPKALVEYQIDQMIKEWDPAVLSALMHGLYRRFALDPKITAASLAALEAILKKKFPAASTEILK